MTPTQLIVEALRARAGQRQSVARQLSTALAVQRAEGKDVRSGALKVLDELAYADTLTSAADQLDAGTHHISLVEVTETGDAVLPLPGPALVVVPPEDDSDVDDEGLLIIHPTESVHNDG
jgi:hypothetical protein